MSHAANIPFLAFYRSLGVNNDPRDRVTVGRELSVPLPSMVDVLPAVGIGVRITSGYLSVDFGNVAFFEMRSLAPGGTLMRNIRFGLGMVGAELRFARSTTELPGKAAVTTPPTVNFGTGVGVNSVEQGNVGGVPGPLPNITLNGNDNETDISHIFIPRGEFFQMHTTTISPSFGIAGTIAWLELQEVLPDA